MHRYPLAGTLAPRRLMTYSYLYTTVSYMRRYSRKRREPVGAAAAPTARRRRYRLAWLSVPVAIVLVASTSCTAVWRARAAAHETGASWAPRQRQVGGLRAIATSQPTGYSLYTAHGAVHFLPGVDLGATTPSHQPGELAITAGDYGRWLNEMGRLGVRAIRTYTIHPPAFYSALADYDRAHPNAPIYLIPGVYLPNDIYLQKGNLYDPVATGTFRQELRDASAAVHGSLTRPPTPGHDSGRWTADVSQWTSGWIIGVEWDPFAVASTDRRNPHSPAVHGRYFHSTPNATATERWLAARMNDMASAVAATGWTVPIAFANWPTTDPLRHPNEPNPHEDLVGVGRQPCAAHGELARRHVRQLPRLPLLSRFPAVPAEPAALRLRRPPRSVRCLCARVAASPPRGDARNDLRVRRALLARLGPPRNAGPGPG